MSRELCTKGLRTPEWNNKLLIARKFARQHNWRSECPCKVQFIRHLHNVSRISNRSYELITWFTANKQHKTPRKNRSSLSTSPGVFAITMSWKHSCVEKNLSGRNVFKQTEVFADSETYSFAFSPHIILVIGAHSTGEKICCHCSPLLWSCSKTRNAFSGSSEVVFLWFSLIMAIQSTLSALVFPSKDDRILTKYFSAFVSFQIYCVTIDRHLFALTV